MHFVMPFQAPKVIGMSEEHNALLAQLVKLWAAKRERNALREMYHDGRNTLVDLGISIPPSLRDVEVPIGWPAKAVSVLAQRCIWDGIVAPSNSDDPFELRGLLDDSRFDIELPQAITSSMAQSVAFVSTVYGGPDEPAVTVRMHSALWAAGIWDRRRRALSSGLTIDDADELGRPTRITLHTPGLIQVAAQGEHGVWSLTLLQATPLGRTAMEALPYRPSLDRPLGRSRITRPVMAITDRAVRTALRMEVSAELFSAPKFILLGADPGTFTDDAGNQIPLWTWYMTRLNTLSRDEDGELPELEKISAESPQPHVELMRELAAEFSGETSVPLSSLGIVQDNPASAEAIYAAKEDLVIEANSAIRVYNASLTRALQNAVMMRDGITEMTQELHDMSMRWRNPAIPSVVSSSDAMVKQISAIPWIAESDVALEELGYTDEQIIRLRSDRRRTAAPGIVETLQSADAGSAQPVADTTNADELKAKFDALGIAIRAGVDPTDAAQRLGLSGIRFTGAVPVSLRMPETDAGALEER